MEESSDSMDQPKSCTISDNHENKNEAQNDSSEFAVPKITSVPKKTDHSKSNNQDLKDPAKVAADDNKQAVSGLQPDTSDKAKHQQAPYNYIEPIWSGKAEEDYSFEVLKNGSIIGKVPLSSKAFHVFGRLPTCDVTLEHPSLSRYHAVVQYSIISTETHEKGWYVYDLDSTHGTWVNKKRIAPKVYHRLRVGYILKFGGSSRLHILQGPSDDADEESEMTVTELKQQKEKLAREAHLLRQAEMQEEMERIEADKKALEDRGCAWGMLEDASDDPGGENPYASLVAENESLYIDDPKKALKGFYDREGCDLPDYQFTEAGPGKHKCTLDLPVDGPNGEDLIAEVVVTGKRKDAVIACALEACRILDKFGLLRSSTHESRKRKQKKWEEDDFYDSDEDTFLDRTGTIEKKRFQRMKKAGKDEAETYESLLEKYNKVTEQIQDIETKLQKAKADAEALVSDEMDELDAYMMSIKSGAMDTKTRMQLKGDLIRLKNEEQKLRKLVNIAKPATLPLLQPLPAPATATASSAELLSKKLWTQQKHHKKPNATKTPLHVDVKPDDYEEHEDDDDEETVVNKNKKQIEERLHGDAATDNGAKDEGCTSKSKRASDTNTSKIHAESQQDPGSKIFKSTSSSSSSPTPAVKLKGPSLPPPTFHTKDKRERKLPSHSSTAAVLENLDREKKAAEQLAPNYGTDPDYAMWLPPEGQSGDGRTSLNEKLGY